MYLKAKKSSPAMTEPMIKPSRVLPPKGYYKIHCWINITYYSLIPLSTHSNDEELSSSIMPVFPLIGLSEVNWVS
jgi:hypothetical protein